MLEMLYKINTMILSISLGFSFAKNDDKEISIALTIAIIAHISLSIFYFMDL